MQPATARSTSAESNTINGAFPPSSKEIFLTVPAHCLYKCFPTLVEPVNDMAATFGLRHKASLTPVRFCFVVITLMTLFGIPASSANAAAANADKGVSSEGFTTVVHPQASAAPSYNIKCDKMTILI